MAYGSPGCRRRVRIAEDSAYHLLRLLIALRVAARARAGNIPSARGSTATCGGSSTIRTRAAPSAGNGGQVVMGIPELHLVIAFFGGNYSDLVMFNSQRVYVPKYILPAVR